MNNTSFQPPELSDENVKNIVKIGNQLLPMLPKKAEEFKKEAKVINYLLSPERNKIISETGKDVVNHADLWNAFANMKKKK